MNHSDPDRYRNGQHNALTLFNSDQVLFSKLLCDRDGLILHSNGFQWAGKGFLLAGKSGSGKSTLSGMLKQRGFNILCDDRMFLRRLKSRFQIHGSWCHGSVPDAANRSAPLDALFFLRQSRQDKIELMTDKNTISRLMVQSMVKPFLDKEDWEKTLDTLSDLIRRTRIYTLYFNLSGSICGKIKEQLGQGGPEQQE